MIQNLSRIVYFDNAATTPILPRALSVLNSLSTDVIGNSSSSHFFGRKAFETYRNCQDQLAKIFDVPSSHILFTSGGTESNNLALWGSLGGLATAFQWIESKPSAKLLTSSIEHDATKKTFEAVEQMNGPVHWINVDHEGLLDLNHLESELNSRVRYASFHHVQNELGVCQNIKSVSELIRSKSPDALIHIDAVQSFLKVPLQMKDLDVDLISISAHKLGGPKGIGLLVLGKRFENRTPKLGNLIYGSSQQLGIRPGTIPIPLIGSMTEALSEMHLKSSEHQAHLKDLSDYFISKLPNKAFLNGSRTHRAPQTVNFSVPGLASAVALEVLSSRGFCISAGSACHSTNPKPNETIMKLGLGEKRALSALRISFGPQNTKQEIDEFMKNLIEVIGQFCFE